MRRVLAAAALAAMTLAVPAAAQTDGVSIMRGAIQQLVANTQGVQDYSLTLRSGALQTEVYVYRDGDEWEVAAPDEDQLGDVLKGVVVWPSFGDMEDGFPDPDELTAEQVEEIADVIDVSSQTVGGRPAHVLFVRMSELMDDADSEVPDSVRMFIDTESRQILRVEVTGLVGEMDEIAPGGGRMNAAMDFGDYRATDGLTVPRSLRMTLDMDLQLSEEQRQGMRAGIQAARAQMAQDPSPEAQQTAAMIDLFIGLLTEGHVELPVTVESVRVNAGPPSWHEG